MKRKAYIRPKSYIVEDSEFMLLAATGGSESVPAGGVEGRIGGNGAGNDKSGWLTKENQIFQDDWSDDLNENEWNIDGL